MSDFPVEYMLSDSLTGVFWDVADFPFPDGLGPDLIYHNMKSTLELLGCDGELSIMAYVDKEHFGDDELVHAYKKAGITIIPQRAGGRSMLPDIAWWEVEMQNRDFYLESAISLMVISKKMDKESVFLTFIQELAAEPYNVLLALPQDPPPPATNNLHTVRFEWLSTRLLYGLNPIHHQDRKRKSREESHETTMPVDAIMPDSPVVESELCVFWDIMEFPFDHCYDPGLIYEGMKSDLLRMGCCGEVSIMAYVDTENLGDEGLLHAYKKAGITIIPLQADIYARAHCMSVDIVLWAMQNPATYFEPRRLLVLSDNVKPGSDFFNALEALKDRYYDVLVALPQEFSMGGVPCIGRFKNPRPTTREEAVGFSNGLASLYTQDFDVSQIDVFWDVKGCPTDASTIGPILAKKGYLGNVFLRPYVDVDYGVDDPLAANCSDSSVRVVSNDPMCDIVLEGLKLKGYNLLFEEPQYMVSFGTSLWSTKDLLDGGSCSAPVGSSSQPLK